MAIFNTLGVRGIIFFPFRGPRSKKMLRTTAIDGHLIHLNVFFLKFLAIEVIGQPDLTLVDLNRLKVGSLFF
jgi:hypothetical protein